MVDWSRYTTSGKSKGEVSFSKSAGGAGAALDFESLQKSVLQTAGDGNYAGDGGSFVQWVFEVRVRPGSYRVQGNTLGGALRTYDTHSTAQHSTLHQYSKASSHLNLCLVLY